MRSFEYFTESILSFVISGCKFSAFSCQSWEQFSSGQCSTAKTRNRMGFYSVKPEIQTNYYLMTGSKPAF
jgi:hypothetical protein